MQNNPLDKISEIDFIPKDIDSLLSEMIRDYELEYEKQNGEKKVLPISSRERIFLNTQALRIYQTYNLIDLAAKQNLLKYSSGAYLDNLTAMLGVERRLPTRAMTKVKFTLSDYRDQTVTIPAGTRVSPGDQIFFSSREDVRISPGELTGEIEVVCQSDGNAGNGYLTGQINILVDPVKYVAKVENLELSQGGADLESDDSLRIRGYYAPKGYSVAGPIEAYQFWIREYSQAVEGVGVFTPEPGKVDIRVTLIGGELPTETTLQEIFNFIAVKRPLTDQLTIQTPDIVGFDLDFTYYIAKSDKDKEKDIQAKVESTTKYYLEWQESTIGRDLNPDMLVAMVITAGAKRLEVAVPQKKIIGNTEIFKHRYSTVTYGGLEDD